MDTKSYLMNQGWSGPGNPLNPARRPGGPHAGLGLSKPILVSRKQNTFGVGKKATHDHTNQWWLRGFEEALRGVGTDGSATPSSTETTTMTAGETGERKGSELYKFFVRGQELPGTINPDLRSGVGDESVTVKEEKEKSAKKRKRKMDEQEPRPELSTKKEGHKKTKVAKRLKSLQDSRDNDNDDDVEAQKSTTKLKKKSKDKKEKRRQQDSVSSEHTDTEGVESLGTEKSKKKKKKKRKRREENGILGVVKANSHGEDGTTKPAMLDKDERKRLTASKKESKEARISKGKDKVSKRSKKKSAKDEG